MDKYLSGLLALLTNRAFYAAVCTIAGGVGLYGGSPDEMVKYGSAFAVLIGLVLGVTAENPLKKTEAAIATDALVAKTVSTKKTLGKKK